jgi:hypothetical protein
MKNYYCCGIWPMDLSIWQGLFVLMHATDIYTCQYNALLDLLYTMNLVS